MNDFTPIKVHFDDAEYNLKLSDFEGHCEYFQNILDKLKLINPNIEFESKDLTPLFNNTKPFLVSKFVFEPTTINGLELSKDKVFDLLECSKDLENIISEINQLNTNTATYTNQKNLYSVTNHYFINGSGSVEIKDSFKTDLQKQYSIFVKTEQQKKCFDCITNIANAYNEFKKHFPHTRLDKVTEEYLDINFNNSSVKINFKALQRI